MSEEVQTTVAEEQQTPTQSETATETSRFIDSISEDIRNEPSLQNIQNVDQLAKSYVHAQRMVGADKIPLPNKHATEDDWSQFYSRLGRPDSPDGYELRYTPPSEGYEATNLPGFQEAAYQAGLNTDQAQQLLSWYNGLESAALETASAQTEIHRTSSEQDLRQDWGLAYDEKLAQANGVFKKFFGSDMAEIPLEDGSLLGNNPQFIRALNNLASNFSEDSITADQTSSGAMTPQEAKSEIAKLQMPGTAYWDKLNPNHQQAVEDVANLYKMAYPDSTE